MRKKVTPRNNSWEATVRAEVLPTGRLRKSFKCQHEADAWASQILADISSGKPVNVRKFKAQMQKKTLADGIKHAHEYKWAGTKSESTHVTNSLTLVKYFGSSKSLDSFDEALIQDFVVHLRKCGKSNATINRKLSCLSVILKCAYKRGWVARKPEIERRKETLSRINYYSKEEQQEIIDTFNSVDFSSNIFADLFVFLCDTGLRLGEALDLNYKDIRKIEGFYYIFVYESKHSNSPPRSIPLTKRALTSVSRGIYGDGPFTSINKRQCRTAWQKLRKLLNKEGEKDFVWHTCRHTFCSLLIQAGEGLTVVKELAGHKDISTTLRYSHLSPINKLNAINKLEQ